MLKGKLFETFLLLRPLEKCWYCLSLYKPLSSFGAHLWPTVKYLFRQLTKIITVLPTFDCFFWCPPLGSNARFTVGWQRTKINNVLPTFGFDAHLWTAMTDLGRQRTKIINVLPTFGFNDHLWTAVTDLGWQTDQYH